MNEWPKFIKDNLTLVKNVISKVDSSYVSSDQLKKKAELSKLVRKQFGFNDKDDSYVINKVNSCYQSYKGASE